MADIELSRGSGAGNTTDSDTVFAYQFLAGIGYAPSNLPSTQWTLGYRYLGTDDPEFAAGAAKISTEYNSHNVEAGLKLRF